MNTEKFNREEISRILKIAAELDHREQQEEESLSRSELLNLADEVGIDPNHIETAIQQLRDHEFEPQHPSFIEENFSFRDTMVLDGLITDELWEDIVTEIRRINGGIGKTSKLGNTYEWEQRKKNTGYLQISITPKEEVSRLRLNASYRYYANFLGLIGGLIGFTAFSVLGNSLFTAHALELLTGGFGAFAGWGCSRLYVRSWMRRKRQTLQSLSHQLTNLFQSHTIATKNEQDTEAQITIDQSSETTEEPDSPPSRLRNK